MKKGAKIALASLLITGVAAVVFFVVRRNKKASTQTTASGTTASTSSSTTSSSKTTTQTSEFPLKKNASVKRDIVKQLQELLNEKISTLMPPCVPYAADGTPITALKVDGYYGDKTAAVVKYYFNNDGNEVTEAMFNELRDGK